MARGKYLSLEEARKRGRLDRFCKEHPSEGDEGVRADDVVRAARGAEKALIDAVSVFDVYRGPELGEGKKSLAIAVTLQPTERTLTDAEIEAVAARIVAAVAKATGGTLRA